MKSKKVGTARSPDKWSANLLKALRKLAEPGMMLAEKEQDGARDFHFVRTGGAISLGAGRLARRVVVDMRAQGLIERRSGNWVITPEGSARLRRAEAGEAGFLVQHAALERVSIEQDGLRGEVTRNRAESPLAWLHNRKDRHGGAIVSDAQFEAGERLRRDFTRAQLMPQIGPSWIPMATREKHRRGQAGGQGEIAAHVLDARARVDKALDAVGGEFAGLLIDVCCLLRGIEGVEHDYGWPRRSGKLVLQLALNALARHYGLISDTARRRQGLRHWGSDDYRPRMD